MFTTVLSNGRNGNDCLLFLMYFLSSLLIAGCASGPIKAPGEISSLSVTQVRAEVAQGDTLESVRTEPVLWGGVILETQNLAEATQIEVMAYPLDRRQRPMLGRDPEGRFLVQFNEYLEPVDYAPGRSITSLGRISGLTSGSVGEAAYQYPTLEASDLHLWSENDSVSRPRFNFGIGVNIGL